MFMDNLDSLVELRPVFSIDIDPGMNGFTSGPNDDGAWNVRLRDERPLFLLGNVVPFD